MKFKKLNDENIKNDDCDRRIFFFLNYPFSRRSNCIEYTNEEITAAKQLSENLNTQIGQPTKTLSGK